MDEAISAMIDEESRLRVMGSGNSVKLAYATVEDKECYHCGEKRHKSYNCPNPRGNGGRAGTRGGRGSTRGGYGGGRGGGCGRCCGANVAANEDTLSITLTGEQVKQWEQWQKGKASESSTNTSLDPVTSTSNNFDNFANYARMSEGTQAQALVSSCSHHIDWVVDSGASKHVTSMSSSFKTYNPYSHSVSIQIVDGTSQLIHDVGSLECTPSLSLSSVLHIPSSPVNLLSVSSIIDQLSA